jgi:NAD(P)-dependent dehydrogenase (short-subunit alcohol dehydrogenase family)
MVVLEAVRASNRSLRTAVPGITALFVGGTSGIGQSTLRQLALTADKPNAYIVGRSESNASPFLAELRQINPEGKFNFIEADVSLIRNVDKACEEIKQKETKLNLLFMTAGGISLSGRNGKSILYPPLNNLAKS